MILNYTKTRSSELPDLVDSHSSEKTVYIRRNIVQVYPKEDEDTIQYEYEEAKLTKNEYEQYLKEISIADIEQLKADNERLKADMDYVAIMTGIDLEV